MDVTQALRRNWGWMLTFGILSIILGIFAIGYSVLTTLVSVLVLAWFLIIGGVIEAIHSIRHREEGHLILSMLESVLAVVIGVLMLSSPGVGAIVLTLLMAAYFMIAGIFRIVTSIGLRLPNWGWSLFGGIVTLLLGIFIFAGWPVTGLWIIGLFIGINLIFSGWARVMLALMVHSNRYESITGFGDTPRVVQG